tara:strand:+ start:234 stop:428 length:195 start_codon:yes stop_codon:yes gene_type:complete
MKCYICNKNNAKTQDYRFIDSLGIQGKILSCEYCFSLNDKTIIKIKKNNENPKKYYNRKVKYER